METSTKTSNINFVDTIKPTCYGGFNKHSDFCVNECPKSLVDKCKSKTLEYPKNTASDIIIHFIFNGVKVMSLNVSRRRKK